MDTTCSANGQRQTETDRLPHLIVKYEPCGKWSQGRPLQRLLDCSWDRNSSRDLKPWKQRDDDEDDDDDDEQIFLDSSSPPPPPPLPLLLVLLLLLLLSSSSSSSSSTMESNAEFRPLNGLLPVSSLIDLYFQV